MTSEHGLHWIKQIGILSTDGVFVFHLGKQTFSFYNNAILEFFGISESEEVTIKKFFQKVIFEDFVYLRTAFGKFEAQSVVENIEFRIQPSTDNIRTLCCSAFLLDEWIVGFVRDLTKIREHENYVTTYGAKKDAILEMVSHNLSGPLNMSHQILLSLEKVTRNYGNNDINEHLGLIRESMNHCLDVINDFLIEEHMVSENVSIRKTRFDVVEKVVGTLERLRKSFPEKEFHFSTEMDPLFVNSDEVKFFQVFNNIALNAVKFTPDKGKIEVSLHVDTESMFLTVRDNGIGIPDALKPFVFQKYSPASRPGLKNERSIGMGLYITQKLTHLMNGTITFSSTENVGSSFTIQLPFE